MGAVSLRPRGAATGWREGRRGGPWRQGDGGAFKTGHGRCLVLRPRPGNPPPHRTTIRSGTGRATIAPTSRRVAFVLGGIGSQWEAMGTRLMYFSAVFRNTMGRLTSHLKQVDPHSPATDLVSLFASGGHSWGQKDFTGIGICAYQIGVINILRDAGLRPDYVVGHSLGESSAGYAAGLQSERETILIQWVRSRMIRKVRTSPFWTRGR